MLRPREDNPYPPLSQAKLKYWTRLADTKFRKDQGVFLAEGVKVVEELLKSPWDIEGIAVLPEKRQYWQNLLGTVAGEFPVYRVDRGQWQKITQDREPEGILAVVKRREEAALADYLSASMGDILILCEVMNPNNLGALLRSARWFGFECVATTIGSVDYTHPKAVRASMGSLFHLEMLSNIDPVATLGAIKKTHHLIGTDVQDGQVPHPVEGRAALILGSESHGLSEEILDAMHERWHIRGAQGADSLSLPQAGAILMYECTKNKALT